MEYYIFRDFQLQGVLSGFNTLTWTRSYNDVGEFQVEMIFDKEMFMLLSIGNFLYKKDTNEACIILERYVYRTESNENILTVKGQSLSHILSWRVFSYTGKTNLYDFVKSLINDNFINPTNSNRRISSLILKDLPSDLKKIAIDVDYSKEEVLAVLVEQLEEVGYGFRVNYLFESQQFEFEVYQGNESEAMFSFEFNNISEQEYYESVLDEKTVALLEDETYSNNNLTGFGRKETAGDVILSEKDMEIVIIDSSEQFKYLVDWDLGDMVTTINSLLGISFQKRIVGIEEFLEPTGKYITLTF